MYYNVTIVVQPVMLHVTRVPVMWHVVVTCFSSTLVLSPNGQFLSSARIAFSERYVHTTLYFCPSLQFLLPATCWLLVCLASYCLPLPLQFLLALATAVSGFLRLWCLAVKYPGYVGGLVSDVSHRYMKE